MSSNHHIRKRSQRQEKHTASDIGGRTVAGSGAAKFSGGGDVRKQGEVRVECKFTDKNHYTLKYSDLAKIATQALKGGLEHPVMLVEFTTGLGLKIAIEPTLFGEAIHLLTQTEKKSFRLKKDEVYKALLGTGECYIIFVDGVVPRAYKIRLWENFLKGLEEKEEC